MPAAGSQLAALCASRLQTRKTQLATLLPHVAPTATVAITLVWAFRDGGYPSTSWYPAGVLVGGLLIAQALGRSLHVGWDVQTAAVGSVFAFATIELASIIWASSKGAAWDSANRTFTYGLIFLMFAGWRSSERAKHLLALFLIAGPDGGRHLVAALRGAEPRHARSSSAVSRSRPAMRTPLPRSFSSRSGPPSRSRPIATGERSFARSRSAVRPASRRSRTCRSRVVRCTPSPWPWSSSWCWPGTAYRTSLALIVALAPTAYFIHTLSEPYEAVDPGRADACDEQGCRRSGARRCVCRRCSERRSHSRIERFDFARAVVVPVRPDRRGRARRCRRDRAASARTARRAAARSAWTSFRTPEASGGVGGTRLLGNLGSNRYDFWRVALRHGEAASPARRRGRQLQRGLPAASPLGRAAAVPAQPRDERALADRSDRQPRLPRVRLAGGSGGRPRAALPHRPRRR